jgi:hypothetical protein
MSRTLLLLLALAPSVAFSANLGEHLGDLESAFRPELPALKPEPTAQAAPSPFRVAPLGGVVSQGQCNSVTLADEQSSCVRVDICTDCAQ